MREEPNSVAVAEAKPEKKILGLIGGMKEGIIGSFEYKGVHVHRSGASVGVSPKGPAQDMRGGRFLLKSGNILNIRSWLDAKAELYEGEA